MIIGVSGKIGAGKDAVADFLVNGHAFKLVRFSDPLKEEVLRTLRKTCEEIWYVYHLMGKAGWGAGWSRYVNPLPTEEELRWMLWIDKPPIIRRLLQEWGTELRRNEKPDYWIEKWADTTHALRTKGISVVAPDVRFLNEASMVHQMGGYVLRVERPGLPVGDHASEIEGDTIEYDHVLVNNGTLDDLSVRVDKYLSFLPQ